MSLSKILIVHNSYQQPGGEDRVFEAEKALLENRVHQITSFERSNEEINSYGLRGRFSLAVKTALLKTRTPF